MGYFVTERLDCVCISSVFKGLGYRFYPMFYCIWLDFDEEVGFF